MKVFKLRNLRHGMLFIGTNWRLVMRMNTVNA